MQHVPAADGVPVDERDDDLRQRSDLALQIEHVEPSHTFVVTIAGLGLDVHVAAGAEGRIPGPGQEGHADARIVADAPEGIDHLVDGPGAKGIAHVLPVDGDPGDASTGVLVADVLVLVRGGPGGWHGRLL